MKEKNIYTRDFSFSQDCSSFTEKLRTVPSAFLFIGLLNVGPKFKVEFMDFHVGLMSVFVVTLFVCVATLQLHFCVFRLCCGFVATFLPSLQCLPFVKFVATKFMNVTI